MRVPLILPLRRTAIASLSCITLVVYAMFSSATIDRVPITKQNRWPCTVVFLRIVNRVLRTGRQRSVGVVRMKGILQIQLLLPRSSGECPEKVRQETL